MRARFFLPACMLCCSSVFSLVGDDWTIFRRGDSNNDGSVNGSDPTHLLAYLYDGGPAPGCMNNADANDDGSVNNADAIYLLNWLYGGGPAPPAPGPFATSCSYDSSALGCAVDPCP